MKAIIRPVRDRRVARSRRGRDARRRLPPPRAGGARGDDADPGGGHRQRLGDRRGRAPALRLLRPHPADRDRGRQPRPGPGRGPQQQPRSPLHERRARHLDRARDPRRADLPGDEAARRPAGRAPAPAKLDRRGLGRVRPDGRDRHRRGHPRGGGGRDRGRDRPAGGLDAPAHGRRLVRAGPRVARRPGGRWDRAAGLLGCLQLDRRLRVLRARPAAEARRPDHSRTATRSGSSRCARTGSSRCASTRRATGEFPRQAGHERVAAPTASARPETVPASAAPSFRPRARSSLRSSGSPTKGQPCGS